MKFFFLLQNLLLKYVFVRTKSSSFLISYLRNLFQFSWRHPFNCCVRLKNYLCISFLTPGLSSNNFVRGFKVCASHSLSKVHIFWEGHKIYELYILKWRFNLKFFFFHYSEWILFANRYETVLYHEKSPFFVIQYKPSLLPKKG